MSVTVANCLELPSLKDASVVAGKGGLDRIVAAISVLEYSNTDVLSSAEFLAGNELIITAFITAKDDVDMQCRILRFMHEKGVVAFVLYYLGIFLPELDSRLVRTADELDLPLIVKPRKRLDYRYRDVITEVMEAIFLDQRNETHLVSTVIERIAQFPEQMQTLSNFLRVISDHTRCTVVLVDEAHKTIGAATWPLATNPQHDYAKIIEYYGGGIAGRPVTGPADMEINGIHYSIVYSDIQIDDKQKYGLLLVKECGASDSPFNEYFLGQITEAIYIFINLHANKTQMSKHLIKAVLNGDYQNIHKVLSHTDIIRENIKTMWVLIDPEAPVDSYSATKAERVVKARGALNEWCRYALVESFENSIVMFIDDTSPSDFSDMDPVDFLGLLCGKNDKACLICFSGLTDWYNFREAYNNAQEYWYALTQIYRNKNTFDMNELSFAKLCQGIIQQGNSNMERHLAHITPLQSAENRDDLLDTLLVYLLDAGNNIRETARLMSFHENSIKYRLKKIRKQLRYDIDKMPDKYELYLSAALYRLYNQS